MSIIQPIKEPGLLLRRLISLGSWLLLLAALILLRFHIIEAIGLSAAEAFSQGLWIGLSTDVMVVILAAWLTGVVQFFWRSGPQLPWSLLAGVLWFVTLANALHVSFFQMSLDLWVVTLHWKDLSDTESSVRELMDSTLVLLSALCMVGAVLLRLAHRAYMRRHNMPYRPKRSSVLKYGVVLLPLLGALWALPVWVGLNTGTPLLKDHIVRVWAYQLFDPQLYQRSSVSWMQTAFSGSHEARHMPNVQLYRALTADAFSDAQPPVPPRTGTRRYPLQYELAPHAKHTTGLRASLGLPQEGPLHVVIVMAESLRAFELYHPDLGPRIFPRLTALRKKHAVTFTQAYSSSQKAGQTVRGHFSTVCSFLPNMAGAATFLAHPLTHGTCLAQLYKGRKYSTMVMNPYNATFHNARLFESLHGSELFFDQTYFRAQGITESISRWGVADKPYLQEALRTMESYAQQGWPIFANIATLSTHHPYKVIPQGPVDAELLQATARHPAYRGFLSLLRYEDEALAHFIERLFKGPMGERTVLVIVGDHSVPQLPHLPLAAHQKIELQFRIGLLLMTKHMPAARTVTHPVHQIDIAPTVAAVSGLKGKVGWLGRNMLQGSGSPWLYPLPTGIAYRTPQQLCIPTNKGGTRCYMIQPGQDPLFDARLPVGSAVPWQKQLFQSLPKEVLQAIVFDRIMPGQPDSLKRQLR